MTVIEFYYGEIIEKYNKKNIFSILCNSVKIYIYLIRRNIN